MQTNEHDFKATYEKIESALNISSVDGFTVKRGSETLAAIKRALLIAEKLMAEPSDAEVGAGIDYALSVKVHGGHPWPSYIAKLRNAMRAKLIEEIDHAEG